MSGYISSYYRKKNLLSLALFLIRDGDFASKLPENLKDAFVDPDSFAQQKLVKLKQVICEQFPVRIAFLPRGF